MVVKLDDGWMRGCLCHSDKTQSRLRPDGRVIILDIRLKETLKSLIIVGTQGDLNKFIVKHFFSLIFKAKICE